MDIHRLRCVVSLADLKNVTKAAEQNYIAQSTMSATITAVEAEIGVQLFIRNNKSVSVTTSGECFVAAAREIVSRYDRAISAVRAIEEGQTPSLTVGFNSVIVGDSISSIGKRFKASHPELTLRLCKGSLSRLSGFLLDGSADIVFSNQFEARRNPQSRYAIIADSSPCVYLPKKHRLAGRSSLVPADIADEYLLCATSEEQPACISAAAAALKDAGIPFSKDSVIPNEEAIFSMVEANIGVYPASTWYRRTLGKRLACVPLIVDVEPMKIAVMWEDEKWDAVARDLASISMEVFNQEA